MRRHFLTMKRVARGLKITAMLLFAIVTYASILKRGKASSRLFFIILTVGISTSLLMTAPSWAKSLVKSQSAARAPAKQIFTRSNRSMRSELLGLSGQAAYIVSSVGTKSGILVTDVSSGGTGAKFGITTGDVLLTLNQRVVTTATDADRILGDTPTGSVKVAFAHVSDAGLQLYNTNFSYSNRGVVSSSPSSQSSGSGSAGGKSGASLTSQISGAESLILSAINQDRSSEHAPAVGNNGTLSALARAHAQDMAKRNYFNHVNPDGLSPQDRANRAGAGQISENISWASGVTDLNSAASTAEHNMMSEPPNQQNHRSNIIDPAHKTVGVGIAVSKDGVFYMAQEFSNGSP